MAQSPVPTREGLILSTATMDLAASAPVFAAGVSLWATSLALVSAASAMPALVRGVGFVASLLFAVASLQMFAGRQLQRLRFRARGPGSHAPLGRGSGRASANSVRPLHQAGKNAVRLERPKWTSITARQESGEVGAIWSAEARSGDLLFPPSLPSGLPA